MWPGTHRPHGEERGEAPHLEPWTPGHKASEALCVRDDDLAVFDPDQIDARSALTAFLAGRTALLELDHAVHARQLDLPERLTDGVGLGLAGLLDRCRDGADAVVAAEALR